MGRKRTQIAAELAGEYGILSLLGGASALQITEGNRGLFILALFLGIQIVTSIAAAKKRAGVLLEEVGLSKELRKKYPAMLSGGEQQRVAIARALGSGARVILADEPTGNLDFENGENIIRILKRPVEEENYCVILVTHDRGIAEQADIVYQVQDGRMDYVNGERL